MIRLIATDLDGTFLGEHAAMPTDAIQTIRQLTKQGVTFAVATGRASHIVKEMFAEVVNEIVIISENGGTIHYKGKLLQANYLAKEDVAEVLEKLETIAGAYPVLFAKDYHCAAVCEGLDIPELRGTAHTKFVTALDAYAEPYVKIAIYHAQGVEKHIAPYIPTTWENRMQTSPSGSCWFDVDKLGVNKGNAIQYMQQYLGISKEETMVFGDYYNDISMLRQGVHSYAMENGVEEAKAVAKNIAQKGSVLAIMKQEVLKEER